MRTKSISHRSLRVLGKALFLLYSLTALVGMANAQQQQGPHDLVREASVDLLETVEKLKAQYGNQVSDPMVDVMIGALEPIVDFQSIARNVTGNHRAAITEEQLQQFTQVFTRSLVSLYLDSFLTLAISEVEVLDPPAGFDVASGRASVQMRATTDAGQQFALNYSMRTDAAGNWKVRNIIVDGINLGLTYLNQFDGAMSRHGNDMDEVIATWSAEIE
ncbi:MAG: ABC transporter substrate-binding protein [Pseudomonadales bacterium]|nr:ABC transporter substrate-binding protein [Pseudomonadales bacterium]